MVRYGPLIPQTLPPPKKKKNLAELKGLGVSGSTEVLALYAANPGLVPYGLQTSKSDSRAQSQ